MRTYSNKRLWLELWCLTPLSTVISWWSVLLMEEIRMPGENHRPAASHLQISHYIVSSTPCHAWDSNSQLSDDSH
jgi:hypothetical protein